MKVISSERAVAQWRAIVRQDPRLAMRVADRFFNEQAPLASFLVWMMRAGTTPPEDSNPSPEMPTEFSRGELILMDYAAMLLELFRRESGRPLPTVEMEELEPRFQALMMRQTDSSTTAPSPASSQPNLFSGLLFVLHSEADSLPEESAMVLPPLIYCMVELFNTLTSSSEDREGALVENWTADRIEEALSVAGDPMRRDALAATNRFRSELVPRLIRAVERVMSVEPAPDSEGDILWIHALFLLADWAEPTAADLAVRFFSADSEALRRLPDPLVRNFAAELMASLLGNEPSRLLEIARSPSTDVGIRGDAIRALGFLGARKQLERPVLLEHLRTLIRGGVVRNSTPEWTVLVGLVMDAGLRELVPDLEPAFRQGWVNEQFFSWESVQELADSPDDRWPQFVQSGPPWSDIAETTGWLDEDATLSRDFSDPSGFSSSSGRFLDEPPGPFRAPPSVGRNDPCPCGSGRKFKKCCGA